MSYIPTPEKALEIVKEYNKEAFHLEHAQTVGKVLAYFAAEHDPERVDFWHSVGILHDIDFELWPEQHCVKANELLRELDMDEELIHAVISHGYGICIDVAPEKYMEKVLFAVDELTGLIGAAALMRPTGLEGMEVKSIKKKFKDKKFAAGCSREVIAQGAEMLGMSLDELFEKTIAAMQNHLKPSPGGRWPKGPDEGNNIPGRDGHVLTIAKSLEELNFLDLMEVYAEGNEENALEFWPEKSPEERRRLAHESFYEYLRDGFYGQSHGTYYIYEESGRYLSALRLESFLDGLLLEALETRPDARRKGHAKTLIKEVQTILPYGTKVYSHVSKSNIASLAAHKACGFEIAYDYGLHADGERYKHQVTFLYTA